MQNVLCSNHTKHYVSPEDCDLSADQSHRLLTYGYIGVHHAPFHEAAKANEIIHGQDFICFAMKLYFEKHCSACCGK